MAIALREMFKNKSTYLLLFTSLVALTIFLLWLGADPKPIIGRKLFGLWRTRTIILVIISLLLAGVSLAKYHSTNAFYGYISALFATGLMWSCLELVGLLNIISWQTIFFNEDYGSFSKRKANIDISGVTYQDISLTWGLESDPIPYHFRTDQNGFRNDTNREQADIYLVGDSIIVGILVPFEKTTTALLEKYLNKPVMQVAISDKGVQETQQYFKESKLNYKGRQVIQFVFEGNDLADSRNFLNNQSSAEANKTFKDRSFTYSLLLKLLALTQPIKGEAKLRSCNIGSTQYLFGWTNNSFIGLEDQIPNITSSIKNFAEEVRQGGGSFAVVFVPIKLRVIGPQCEFPEVSELKRTFESSARSAIKLGQN